MLPPLRRHDLAWLDPAAALPGGLDLDDAGWLRAWIADGRALVVAGQSDCSGPLPAEFVRLGVLMPPRLDRRRIAVRVARTAIRRIGPPLAADAVHDALPASTAAALAGFARRVAGLGVTVGVYGSTAWQVIAGEAYRSATSDLDLVCDLADAAVLPACLAALAATAARSPTRIDGEIRFADGRAVAWRELAQSRLAPRSTVLVKSLHAAALASVGELLGGLA